MFLFDNILRKNMERLDKQILYLNTQLVTKDRIISKHLETIIGLEIRHKEAKIRGDRLQLEVNKYNKQDEPAKKQSK